MKTKTPKYKVPPLTKDEKALVATINSQWDKSKALYELTSHLQVAATIELATIPIYLGTYYTINRTPGKDTPYYKDAFPKSDVSRFADRAGALIMSVAVEEMLHMSLASNVLYSLGEDPQLYLNAPSSYPANLPGHNTNVSPSSKHFSQNIPIPLARFSFTQLSHFLAIEYPAPVGAPPEAGNWDTIGQIYSYIRCIIESDWIDNEDFQVRKNNLRQIAATEYSPNNIDTIYPEKSFDFIEPVPAPEKHSAAKVAEYANKEDSHVGVSQLVTINSCDDAVQAITTICFQGEGFAHESYDDPSEEELSHYYKFLELQSQINGYTEQYVKLGRDLKNNVAPLPKAPKPASRQYSPMELDTFVYPAPFNPTSSQFGPERSQLVDIADGLFQYMLVMTETIYRIPQAKQKIYFNRAMHQSMIWVMDKFLQAIREIKTADGRYSLCATFANINLGSRHEAYGTLSDMVKAFQAKFLDDNGKPKVPWLTSDAAYYLNKIIELPDVSIFWAGTPPTEKEIKALVYLEEPNAPQDLGTAKKTKARTKPISEGPYKGVPQWPLSPPKDNELPDGAMRHACMGLNSCKDQGRTADNDCAGQGYCSTALAYNPTDPSKPSYSDHTCHVLNDCRGQGGCGLYGTQEELDAPGQNDCQSKGSCATPINAERFITDGDLRGTSVWVQARAVFTEKVWPEIQKEASSKGKTLPKYPPQVPGSDSNPNVFQYGPTIEWIETDNGNQGMTACGSSGMSGAGSCA